MILASRILFITFLVLAFAQPFIPAQEKELQSYVQIYLDNSYSMSNESDEDLSGLDQGISLVNEIIDQYPAGTRFRLLTNDFEPFSNVFRSGEEAREITTELSYSRISRNLGQIREKLKTEEVGSDQLDTYWISDFQSSLYTEPLEDSISVRLLPVSFTSSKNIFIDSVYTETPFIQASERVKLFARLVNRGDKEAENLNLKVFINDNQVTTNSVDVPADGIATAEFDIAFSLDSYNQCRISFEDYPVTFDNDFYFILSTQQRIDVVEVRGFEAEDNVGQVFGNEELFNFQTFPMNNLDYNAALQADLVILNEVDMVDNSLLLLLSEYLDSYGVLSIIPSADVDIDGYLQLLPNINLRLADSTRLVDMALPDLNNPFFEDVFEGQNQNMKMPSATSRWSWFNDRDAILRMGNGDPFLSRISRRGDVFLFASPMKTAFTDFQLHALFVPVMYKMAISSVSGSSNLYVSLADNQVILPVDSIPAEGLIKIVNSESEIIPQQRLSAGSVVLDLPSTQIATGFYEVKLDNLSIDQLAFNYDSRESVLNQLQESEIERLFQGSDYEIFTELSPSGGNEVLYAKYQPTALWKYAILLAVLFLVAEILIFKLFPG